MKTLPVLALLAALAGCETGPRLNAGISIGAGGVHVHPSVSGRVGGARVSIAP